ncbi:hypothetical protein HAX54_042196 [Datura stramonium]|uniref:Uncharacterized protein n=1 Tax=Datura stramonium TaxID=4076 RepID=A0ABS8W2T8_DATST|nr:hypothetical protein [Datura stramonium]
MIKVMGHCPLDGTSSLASNVKCASDLETLFPVNGKPFWDSSLSSPMTEEGANIEEENLQEKVHPNMDPEEAAKFRVISFEVGVIGLYPDPAPY